MTDDVFYKTGAMERGALCRDCPYKYRKYVPGCGPRGPVDTKYVVIGEAPGHTEAKERKPFVGDSGRLLRTTMIEDADINPDDVYFTNVVKCLPTGKLSATAIKCCSPLLADELAIYKQTEGTRFLALGVIAAEVLLPGKGGSQRGKWFYNDNLLCTWHPAHVLRNPYAFGDFKLDLKRLERGKQKSIAPTYTVVKSEDELQLRMKYVYSRSDTVCLDLETSHLLWWKGKILCYAVAMDETYAFVVPRGLVYTDTSKDELTKLFSSNAKIVGHNVKFDLRYIIKDLDVINARADYDSLVAHYVLDENSRPHGLKKLVSDYLDAPDYEARLVTRFLRSKKESYSKIPPGSLMEYNALDVCYNLRLWNILADDLVHEGLFEKPFMYPLMEAYPHILNMELQGVPVDTVRLWLLQDELSSGIEQTKRELHTLAGMEFNPNSWQQLQVVMYDHLGMPEVHVRGKPRRTTAKEARILIANQIDPDSDGHRFLSKLTEYKSLAKLKSSYVDNMFDLIDPEDRVHPNILLHGTRTGRPSARSPAIQTIPRPGTGSALGEAWGKRVKDLFTACGRLSDLPGGPYQDREKVLLSADYSQAEMRVATCLAGDPFLVNLYKEGRDIHTEVAIAMYGPDFTKENRQTCKNFNFAYIYGGTEYSFTVDEGMDISRARRFVRKYQEVLPGLSTWRDEQFKTMKAQGYVETLTGRRRRFPLITQNNVDDARKSATNSPIQGVVGDLCLISLIEIAEWIESNYLADTHIIITIYDSNVLLLPGKHVDYVALNVKRIMENVGTRYFPQIPWVVDCEVGSSWGSMENLEV